MLIVIGGGTASYWKYGRSKNGEIKFRTAAVDRGEITSIVNSSGTTNPLMRVDLGSQVSGIVQKLHADFNDPVKAGQLMAEIDPATFEAQVTQAKANLIRAEADFTNAKLALARAQQLQKSGVGTQSDLDAAQAKYDMAAASELQARASLDQSQTNLRNTKIFCPIEGIVIDRKVEVGQTVAAGLNVAVLYVIANDLTKMQVNTLVDEADIGRVSEGQDVEFSVDAYPRETFKGKVHQVRNAAIVKQEVVNYDVIVRVDNPEKKLKPGMTANVQIIVNHKTDVLRVPNSALRFKPPTDGATMPTAMGAVPASNGGQRSSGRQGGRRPKAEDRVYVLDELDKPKRVPIQIGAQDESYTEIVSGLTDAQTIIVGTEFPKGVTVQSSQMPNPWQMKRF